MHQVGPKVNFPENVSFLALKGEAVSVAQISPYGGARDRRNFFFALNMFLWYKMV
jgi:hypothetical protein